MSSPEANMGSEFSGEQAIRDNTSNHVADDLNGAGNDHPGADENMIDQEDKSAALEWYDCCTKRVSMETACRAKVKEAGNPWNPFDADLDLTEEEGQYLWDHPQPRPIPALRSYIEDDMDVFFFTRGSSLHLYSNHTLGGRDMGRMRQYQENGYHWLPEDSKRLATNYHKWRNFHGKRRADEWNEAMRKDNEILRRINKMKENEDEYVKSLNKQSEMARQAGAAEGDTTEGATTKVSEKENVKADEETTAISEETQIDDLSTWFKDL